MPCHDGRSSPEHYEAEANKENRRLRERLDEVTRIACEMGRYLKSNDRLEALTHEAQLWYKDHQKFDESRINPRKAK